MSDGALKPACVAVAFSGGRDSTALLHATACAALEHGDVAVVALHVHHGISAQADAWWAHAELMCAAWREQGLPVRLVARRVQLDQSTGDSLEAVARQARYEALGEMAGEAGADLILLAHHRRDQAETFLLQALRGAGVSGLAGMPADIVRDGLRWVRPWLAYPREAVEAYVAHHGLVFVEDDSNANTRFARNRLRLDVWPALLEAFPQAESALAASAHRVADVLPGVDDWRDRLVLGLQTANEPRALDAVRWSELSGGERREALRHWYLRECGQALPASWLARLAHEIPGLVFHQRPARWAEVGIGLYRGVLTCGQHALALRPFAEGEGGAGVPRASGDVVGGHARASGADVEREAAAAVVAPGDIALPGWGGILRATEVDAQGVRPGLLAHLTLRSREGREQFQSGPQRPARSLKKQFQAAGVPAWCRDGPLVYVGDRLVFVPGLGVDARVWAAPGELQWTLDWVSLGA